MTDLIAQLKDPDPNRRRAAVYFLVNAGDASVIDILRRVAATDPDRAIRDLAEKGAGKLQVTQWQRAQQETQHVAQPEEIEPTVRDQREREARRLGNAQSILQMAVHHAIANERDSAMKDLTEALTIDPALAANQDARRLACMLLGIADPDQAIQALQTRIAEAPAAEPKPAIKIEGLRVIALAVGLAVALFVLLAVFYRVYNHDLPSIVYYTTFASRLSAFFRALTLASLARAFLPALLLLVAIVGGNLGMYLLSTIILGCTSTVARFVSALEAAQILILAIGLLCLVFMPVVTVVTGTALDGTAITNMAVSAVGLYLGVLWAFLLQSTIVARVAEAPLQKSFLVVLGGCAIFYVLARLLLGITLVSG